MARAASPAVLRIVLRDGLSMRLTTRGRRQRVKWKLTVTSRCDSAYWKGRLWSPSYFPASCGGAPRQHSRGLYSAAEHAVLRALSPRPEVRSFTAPAAS